MKNKLALFSLSGALLFLSGCSIFTPYTPPIQQGKIIPQDVMKQIKPGMTKEQIKYILGSPDTVDPFTQNQWNYVYTYQNSFDAPRSQRELILIFMDNKLTSISGDYSPPETIYMSK